MFSDRNYQNIIHVSSQEQWVLFSVREGVVRKVGDKVDSEIK